MLLINFPDPPDHDVYDADELHLPGLQAHDSITLCGFCWPEVGHIKIHGDAPTCQGCIEVAKTLFDRYTRKQVNSWGHLTWKTKEEDDGNGY